MSHETTTNEVSQIEEEVVATLASIPPITARRQLYQGNQKPPVITNAHDLSEVASNRSQDDENCYGKSFIEMYDDGGGKR